MRIKCQTCRASVPGDRIVAHTVRRASDGAPLRDLLVCPACARMLRESTPPPGSEDEQQATTTEDGVHA